MYKVISINDDEMTRDVELINSITGTIDKCFDDSALMSEVNFDFLHIGNEYDCKIKLFGNVVQNMQDKTVLCKVICNNMIIGTKQMVKVLVENDEYYIPTIKIKNVVTLDNFYFKYTRKDLIKVDNVVHPDLL